MPLNKKQNLYIKRLSQNRKAFFYVSAKRVYFDLIQAGKSYNIFCASLRHEYPTSS